ncbi:hypothetical protein [Hyphomicrobium sp.]|uniref:hypothetical protein n=1 Tax=Hyphomicrobium sp. TaxID=82 RepID=UPI003F718C13
MSVSRADERRVLSHEQFELVGQSHHPAIYGIDAKSLQSLQTQLRNERDKVRTQVRQKLREGRGKSEARGKSFPGNTEQPLKRKQALANALKRVNKELERVRKLEARSAHVLEARTAHVDAARRALELLRNAKFHPTQMTDKTPKAGMAAQPSTKRRRIIPGSQIGSVSQATKNAQAKRDNRGKS